MQKVNDNLLRAFTLEYNKKRYWKSCANLMAFIICKQNSKIFCRTLIIRVLIYWTFSDFPLYKPGACGLKNLRGCKPVQGVQKCQKSFKISKTLRISMIFYLFSSFSGGAEGAGGACFTPLMRGSKSYTPFC